MWIHSHFSDLKPPSWPKLRIESRSDRYTRTVAEFVENWSPRNRFTYFSLHMVHLKIRLPFRGLYITSYLLLPTPPPYVRSFSLVLHFSETPPYLIYYRTTVLAYPPPHTRLCPSFLFPLLSTTTPPSLPHSTSLDTISPWSCIRVRLLITLSQT